MRVCGKVTMRVGSRLGHPAAATIAVLLLLAGCSTPTPVPTPIPVIDRSPFAGNPCSPPCWQGLLVGKSTEAEVKSRLTTLTSITQGTIQYSPRNSMPGSIPGSASAGLEISANLLRPRGALVTISVPDHLLVWVDIHLVLPFSAEEAIADLGPPDLVGRQLLSVEELTCKIVLIWNSRQLVLESAPEPAYRPNPCDTFRATGKVPADLNIRLVRCMTIPWIGEILKDDGAEYAEFSGFLSGR